MLGLRFPQARHVNNIIGSVAMDGVDERYLNSSFFGGSYQFPTTTQPVGFTGWFYPTTLTAGVNYTIASRWFPDVATGGLNSRGVRIELTDVITPGSHKLVYWFQTTILSAMIVRTATTIATNQWYHFGVTRDGVDDGSAHAGDTRLGQKIWLNGEHETTLQTETTLGRMGTITTPQFCIGARQTNDAGTTFSHHFAGRFAQLLFFNHFLMPEEIAWLWNGGKGRDARVSNTNNGGLFYFVDNSNFLGSVPMWARNFGGADALGAVSVMVPQNKEEADIQFQDRPPLAPQ